MDGRSTHETLSAWESKSDEFADPATDSWLAELREANRDGRDFVLAAQRSDGTWSNDPAPDIRTTAEYVAMCAWFGTHRSTRAEACVRWLAEALSDSATLINLDFSALSLARLALFLGGQSIGKRAAHELESLVLRGRASDMDSVTRTYLAIFNQLPFDPRDYPAAEFVLLPTWAPANLASFDRWSRAVSVPVAILAALGAKQELIAPNDELQTGVGEHRQAGMSVLHRLTYSALRMFRATGGVRPLALRRATQWIVARVTPESGVAGCMSATALSAIALDCLGFDRSSPAVSCCFEALHRCQHQDGGIAARPVPLRLTTQAVSSLALSDDLTHCASAIEALLDREVMRQGDWSASIDVAPGGWPAEENNDRYPDVACTAAALVALRTTFSTSPASSLVNDDAIGSRSRSKADSVSLLDRVAAASRRARRWLLAMQRADGSWNASERSGAMPATSQFDERHLVAATTGLVLVALGRWEVRAGQAAVDKAVSYLRKAQDHSGIWLGGGVFDLYATWMAIEGLSAVGADSDDPTISHAAVALCTRQNLDGSFGFRKALREDGSNICTAWALSAMIAANQRLAAEPVRRAAAWLSEHQLPGGAWRVENSAIFSTLGLHSVSDMSCTLYAQMAIARFCNRVIGDAVHDPQTTA